MIKILLDPVIVKPCAERLEAAGIKVEVIGTETLYIKLWGDRSSSNEADIIRALGFIGHTARISRV